MGSGFTARGACARYGIFALLAAGISAPALAQSGIPAPPTRDELEAITRADTPPPPRLDIEGGIERSPCPLADPQYADVTVTVTDVTFNNLKGATPAEMMPAWEPFRGQAAPIAAICEIRDAAATLLRNKGYLAAVQVPTQRIEDGRVTMEVLYARVSTIRARGETRGAETKLEQYLGKLTEGEVFNRFDAERYLLLARDLPGYNVQLTLKPAGTGQVGDLIGEVRVLRRPYQVDATIQNLSSRATGRWAGQLRASAFGLTGMGDATYVSLYSTADFEEQIVAQIGHSFRPGAEGLEIDASLTYAMTEPGVALAAGTPAIEADTLLASVGARYPLKRSQARSMWVGGGFDFVNQDVDFIGPLTQDKLRVLWLRAETEAIDLTRRIPRWRYASSVEFRKGFDILDASERCVGAGCVGLTPTSRFDGKATAALIRGESEFEYAMGTKLSLLVSPRWQYAFDRVLAFEEYTVGNFTVGRGYDPGSLTGDSGLGAAVELRGPRLRPTDNQNLAVQPFAFVDYAATWQKGISGSEELGSAGGGLRATLSDKMFVDATLAAPFDRAPLAAEKDDVRFLLTFSTRILPWRSR